jgi:DNA-binding PadR family transcriptional regulator
VSTNLREVILGLLLDRPNHAYALKQILRPRFPPSTGMNDGVLYPLLGKLEAEGLIRGREEVGPQGRRRTSYTVTRQGERAFLDWLTTTADEGDDAAYDFFLGRPFLVKLQFFTRLPAATRMAKIEAELARLDAKLALFAEIRAGMVERKADPWRIALIDLGARQTRLTRRWLKAQAATGPGA